MLEPDPELAVAYGIFSVRQALGAGYSRDRIKRQVQLGRWARLDRGLLAIAGRVERPMDEMVIDRLRAGAGAVVSGESAAQVHGWELLRPPGRTKLTVPLSSSKVSAAYRTTLGVDDVVLCGVLAVTSPRRTALDIACTADVVAAVVAVDSALRSRQVDLRQLHHDFHRSHRNGVEAARAVLAAVDAESGSVIETEARLLFARAGLLPPVSQFTLRTEKLVARVDFAWEEATLAVEIDGFAYHSASGDFQRDRRRQNAVQVDGWLVLRFTAADIRQDPEYVIETIRLALARRLP